MESKGRTNTPLSRQAVTVPNLQHTPQVDRGVPFSMGLTLKEQSDIVASAETARFEAKEAELKKATQEVRYYPGVYRGERGGQMVPLMTIWTG